FVTDHVEVIWDLDTEAKETAEEHQLAFRRVATSGADPRFVSALADLVQERLDPDRARPHVADFPPMPDVCGTGCCRNAKSGIVPTTSAVDSAADIEQFAGPEAARAYEGRP
ncbi:MAG: ferrochelatase, partial [Brachybacterium sp.]|nr:ferrochelatase [Brachybacterium sp.]